MSIFSNSDSECGIHIWKPCSLFLNSVGNLRVEIILFFKVASQKISPSKYPFCFIYSFPSITIGTKNNASYSIFRIMLIIFSISFRGH